MGLKMLLNAKILVIEDDSDYLETIIRRLKKKGYLTIESVSTLSSAINELDNAYDVIVADMRLGDAASGGFTVVDEIKKRNITSIVIILTANDSVIDCRKALQYGGLCWDYIFKSMTEGSALEELHNSIQKGLKSRGNGRDILWIEENKGELLTKYSGKYIAVINWKESKEYNNIQYRIKP